jgi:hypothetical protein
MQCGVAPVSRDETSGPSDIFAKNQSAKNELVKKQAGKRTGSTRHISHIARAPGDALQSE